MFMGSSHVTIYSSPNITYIPILLLGFALHHLTSGLTIFVSTVTLFCSKLSNTCSVELPVTSTINVVPKLQITASTS